MTSAYTCAETRTLAPELALEVLGGAERAEALEHLGSCAGCRNYLAELTEVVDALPVLVAEADPPAGFEARALQKLGVAEPRWRRRFSRTVVALIAAMAVAAAASIASVAGVRIAEGGATRPARDVAEAALVDRQGAPVGTVVVPSGSRRVVFVAVDGSLPRGAYTLEGRNGNGGWSRIDRFDVAKSAAYVAAPVPDSSWPLTAVRVVDPSGSTVAVSAVGSAGGAPAAAPTG